MSDAPRYQPYWCEENVWHLCADERVPAGARAVIVISNRDRTVACLHQRCAPAGPVIWDYHVVLAVRGADAWSVWDLDTTLGLPVAIDRWLASTFGSAGSFAADLVPRFRVIAADEYVATLCSDRRHMIADDGTYTAPPPPWLCIGTGAHNLERFIDVAASGPGIVVDREMLVATLDAVANQSSSKRP